jgi:hypothetical protein
MRFYDGIYSATGSFFSLKSTFFVGSRFYLLKNLAAYAELGYGISYFNFGIAWNAK